MIENFIDKKEHFELQVFEDIGNGFHNCWRTCRGYNDAKTREELIPILNEVREITSKNSMDGDIYRIVKVETKIMEITTRIETVIEEEM